MFSLEEAECIAFCDRAPCLQVNHRFFGSVDDERFDTLVEDLAAGRLDDDVPPHGVLSPGAPPGRARRARRAGPGRAGRGRPGPGGARRGRPGREVLMALTDASPIVTARLRHRRLAHARAVPGDRWLRRAAQGPAHDAGAGRRGGERGQPARARGRRLPRRAQVVDAPPGAGALPGRQRRRERAGHLQGPPADRARPARDHRGHAHRRLRQPGRRRPSSTCGASSPSGWSGCRPP